MKLFAFSLFVCFLLVGCTTPIDSTQTVISEPVDEEMLSFPEFDFVDENNTCFSQPLIHDYQPQYPLIVRLFVHFLYHQ